jgi:DNA topoisomerase-1
MGRSLVIVESPAKAKTINKYLGKDFTVKASLGHILDLPKKVLGIDIEHGFEPDYEPIPGKSKIIAELKKAAKDADAVYLAGDPDREGEAICAHLAHVLGTDAKQRKKIFRVLFNEITPRAIRAAFEKPGQVDTHLVDAQQARRVLDRLVGYKISPLLWDKVRRGLSAGRVQTVALRLIVEREREIRAFVPQEYWTIHALLEAAEAPKFEAKFFRREGKEIEVANQAAADAILKELEGAKWRVATVQQKEKRRHAAPPFTTSKLQQEAYNKLRFSSKRTMMLAQKLYEGVELGSEGSVALITYMRTDSVRVSNEALEQVREFIGTAYGPGYIPEKPTVYKSKKEAQEAHEAVRPTEVSRSPEDVKAFLDDDLYRLYRLIWQRFVASQMVPAVFDHTTLDIAAGPYIFRASGSVLKFDGFLAVYQEAREEKDEETEEEGRKLPRVEEGEILKLEAVRPEQHFTEPPPRYTDATIVKELEEKGIGRPSTYASIISTLVDREYVTKDQGRFTPTQLGEKVNDLLIKGFPDIFDVGFTARMEDELDEIEEGKLKWQNSVGEFWGRFEADLERAGGAMESYKAGIRTDEKCPTCGQGMLLERISRHGFFMGCERYPECDYTRDLSEAGTETVEGENATEYCDNCGKEMIIKRGRFGMFLACSGYPECKTTRRLVQGTKKARQPDVALDESCPLCGNQLLKRQGRFGEFIGCAKYPKCKYTRPILMGIKCPKCGEGEFVRRGSPKGRGKGRIFYGCSRYPDCDYTTPHEPIGEPCPRCGGPFIVEKRTKMGNSRACAREGCDWEMALPGESVPVPVASAQEAAAPMEHKN